MGSIPITRSNPLSARAALSRVYLNEKTGREFSAVGGVTYNFENDDTHYRNGIDSHIDWGASQFLNEQVHVGLVGYFYYQLTGDSGSGATLGDFKSRVSAIGPQIGLDTSSRLAPKRGTRTSRVIGNSRRRIVPMAGISGLSLAWPLGNAK